MASSSSQVMRTEGVALDGTARTVLHGFIVTLAVAVAALMTALYVAEAAANPGLGVDDAALYVVD